MLDAARLELDDGWHEPYGATVLGDKIVDIKVDNQQAVAQELQKAFGTTDLRSISTEHSPWQGIDGLRVSYRPDGDLINDPDNSLSDILQSHGLPLLAATMRT